MLHLILPTQPCSKLLTNDPHKTVSVAEAVFKGIPGLGRFLLERSCWQHTDQPDWGKMSRSCRFNKFFIWRVWYVVERLSLSVWKCPYWRHKLSSCLRLWADQYWDLLPVVSRCNSPRSCCPGELWWGCCWGWMTGCAPPWCRGPRRFLKNEKQGREDVWAWRRLQPGSSSGSCEITEVVLSTASAWKGDPYRWATTRRGREPWTLRSPDPPWWHENGVTSAFHLQKRHKVN